MITPIKRQFVTDEFDIKNLDQIRKFLNQLLDYPLNNSDDLTHLLSDLSELEAVVGEEAAWLQIRLTTDTSNEDYEAAFTQFVSETEPVLKEGLFAIYKKIVSHPDFAQLKTGDNLPYLRALEGSVHIFRQENIALQSEESLLAQKYGSISGQMGIEYEGKDYTMQQAALFLESPDRKVREEVYSQIQNRRLQDRETLFDLFFQLRAVRDQIAKQAGFDNYRDYKFASLGRYDYTPDDCFQFHENVKKHFLPIWEDLLVRKMNDLGYSSLRPWDLDAPLPYERELKPFQNGEELTDKSIALFSQMDSYFGQCISVMKDMNRLDLDSRKSKAPGGYNCPLPETGVPFIFMNSAGTVDDLITMMHESGHAFHSFLTHDLPWGGHKEYPMEMAELASMSMELMTMDYWSQFFTDVKDLDLAKTKELERVVSVLPWVATIDKFQHWIYIHPHATKEELTQSWFEIHQEFSPQIIDWSGLDNYRANLWQKQLHLFEVPFYYIEYGIAQIGAIGIWQNYLKDKKDTLEKYKAALAKGYTQTLPDLYKTAGIPFDFGNDRMKELAEFIKTKIEII